MCALASNFDFLYTAFCNSPTKGLAIFENLLLPENDGGVNENIISRFISLKDENAKKQLLFDGIVKALRDIRKAVLENTEAYMIIEQRIEMIREIVATDMLIAEDKLKLGNMKL